MMKLRHIPLLFLMSFILFPCLGVAEIKFSDRIEEYTLDNEMKVILIQDKRSPIVVSSLWYKVGSSFEYPGVTGISHILEHMMFKGTTTTEAGEFSRIIKQLGGSENAFTGRDFTGYYQKVHKDYLETCLKYESDRMVNLMLNQEDLRTEREVVKEERRLRTEDNPSSKAYEKIGMQIFGLQKYGIPIIGTMEDISNISTQDLKDWYNRYYKPSNATLIIAGDFQELKTKQLIEKYFGPIQNKNTTSESRKISHQKSYKDIVLKDNVSSPLLVMSFGNNAYDMNDPSDSYALEVLFELMDGGFSSRFTKNITDKKIALNTFIYFDTYAKEENLISIGGTPRANKSIIELETAIINEFKNIIENDSISDEEMSRIKSRVIASNVYKFDSVFYQAMQVGMLETKGFKWQLLDSYITNIMSVDYSDLKRVTEKYILNNKYLTTAVIPK